MNWPSNDDNFMSGVREIGSVFPTVFTMTTIHTLLLKMITMHNGLLKIH